MSFFFFYKVCIGFSAIKETRYLRKKYAAVTRLKRHECAIVTNKHLIQTDQYLVSSRIFPLKKESGKKMLARAQNIFGFVAACPISV